MEAWTGGERGDDCAARRARRVKEGREEEVSKGGGREEEARKGGGGKEGRRRQGREEEARKGEGW